MTRWAYNFVVMGVARWNAGKCFLFIGRGVPIHSVIYVGNIEESDYQLRPHSVLSTSLLLPVGVSNPIHRWSSSVPPSSKSLRLIVTSSCLAVKQQSEATSNPGHSVSRGPRRFVALTCRNGTLVGSFSNLNYVLPVGQLPHSTCYWNTPSFHRKWAWFGRKAHKLKFIEKFKTLSELWYTDVFQFASIYTTTVTSLECYKM